MKTKKVLPLVLLLFVAIMLLSVGMIAKEHRECRQDIKGVEKLEDMINETKPTEMTDNVDRPKYRRNRNSPHAILNRYLKLMVIASAGYVFRIRQ